METLRILMIIIGTLEDAYNARVSAAGVSLLADYLENYGKDEVIEACNIGLRKYSTSEDFFKKLGGTLYTRRRNTRADRACEDEGEETNEVHD